MRKDEVIEVLNKSLVVNERMRSDILRAFETHNELNKEMFANYILEQYD